MMRIAERHIKGYLLSCLLVSLLFSLTIFLKLEFAPIVRFFDFALAHVILYDMHYYLMPALAIFFLYVFCVTPISKIQPGLGRFFVVEFWVFLAATAVLTLIPIDILFNVPLLYVFLPMVSTLTMYAYFSSKESPPKSVSKKTTAIALAIIILVPYATVFLSFSSTLSTIGASQSNSAIAEFVSDYVGNITASFWGLEGFERIYFVCHRASSDFLKFLLVGVGSCSEMAHATKAFLDNLDLESRIVSFPGEDHAFVEASLNGTWLVLDPGYGLDLVTRADRGSIRLKELGGLSYVIADSNQGPIEVTKEYVSTDHISIRVTDSGEPVANAKVVLSHIFMGSTRSLPEFHSDINGTVKLSLGPTAYNSSKIEPVEPYYWIWVNDKNTGLQASSTGSGKSVTIEVDLAKA